MCCALDPNMKVIRAGVHTISVAPLKEIVPENIDLRRMGESAEDGGGIKMAVKLKLCPKCIWIVTLRTDTPGSEEFFPLPGVCTRKKIAKMEESIIFL